MDHSDAQIKIKALTELVADLRALTNIVQAVSKRPKA